LNFSGAFRLQNRWPFLNTLVELIAFFYNPGANNLPSVAVAFASSMEGTTNKVLMKTLVGSNNSDGEKKQGKGTPIGIRANSPLFSFTSCIFRQNPRL